MRRVSDTLRCWLKREKYTASICGRDVKIIPFRFGWTWEIPSLGMRGRWNPTREWAEAMADWWLFKEFEEY